jgi:hypothetical protein
LFVNYKNLFDPNKKRKAKIKKKSWDEKEEH